MGWAISFTIGIVITTFSFSAVVFEFQQNDKDFAVFQDEIDNKYEDVLSRIQYTNDRIDKITGRLSETLEKHISEK